MQDEETTKPRTTALNPAYRWHHMPLKVVVRAFECRFRLLPRRRKPCSLWLPHDRYLVGFSLRQNAFAPFKLHARIPALLATVEMKRGGKEAIACSAAKVPRFFLPRGLEGRILDRVWHAEPALCRCRSRQKTSSPWGSACFWYLYTRRSRFALLEP